MGSTTSLKTYPVSLNKALVILMTISSIVVVLFLNSYFDKAVEDIYADMNAKLLKNNSELISHRVGIYLQEPKAAGTLMSLMFTEHDAVTSMKIETELKHLIKLDFKKNQPLSSISFATADGHYTALKRDDIKGNFHAIASTEQEAYIIQSCQGSHVCRKAHHQIMTRPWFIRARETHLPVWTETPVHTRAQSGMTVTWRQPVKDRAGHFFGVISADIKPSEMSNWLHSLVVGKSHQLMLLNENGRLIASSSYIATDELQDIIQHLPSSRHAEPTIRHSLRHNLMLSRPVNDAESGLKWTLVMLTPDNQWQTSISRYHQRNFYGLFIVIFLSLLTITLLLLKFSRPLLSLINRVHLLGTPSWAVAAKGTLFPEVASLANALDNKSRLITDMLDARQKQVEQDVETGLLTFTGLCNHPDLYQQRNMLALVHLSNHSSLTNLLGKDYGYSLLNHLITLLKETLPADTIFCRERTDKILMVFPEVTSEEQATDIHQQLENLFTSGQTTHSGRHELLIAGNAGIVAETLTAERLKPLVLNAGIALHHARQQGNGVVTRFAQEMHEAGLRNVQLHEQLHHALDRNEFHLVMQPIVSLDSQTQCIEGECLVRWQSPTMGFVPPDQFIALAEQTGLIIPLGDWIIETACRELAAFITRGAPENFKLHINVSTLQLQQEHFAQALLFCIQRNALHNNNICVEVTESVLLDDASCALQQLNALRDAGVTVSLDDFGSGYSSLSYLHSLPFDQLKIDRQFVSNILEDSRSESVFALVLNLAHSFQVPLVAEGIENQETGEKLRNMGCGLAQGYHYGRPQPFDAWHVEQGIFKLIPA